MASDLFSGITVLCFHMSAQVIGLHKGLRADGAVVLATRLCGCAGNSSVWTLPETLFRHKGY